MIDIDIKELYRKSHGFGELLDSPSDDPYSLADATNSGAVNNVCRKVLELRQAVDNLGTAIASCGDSVRFSVKAEDGLDELSATLAMAAVVDGMSGWRSIFLDVDNHDALDGIVVRALHDSCDTSQYVRRLSMRLRRSA